MEEKNEMMETNDTNNLPDPMTPEWSRDLAEVRMSPFWRAADGFPDATRRDTFIEQAAGYATYDALPGNLKLTFQQARRAMHLPPTPDDGGRNQS